MYRKWVVFVFMSVLSMIQAQISCKYDEGSTHLTCSPGDKDYTLRRGDVSDNKKTYSIQIKACRIVDLNTDSFQSLPSLVNLDLSLNKIASLPASVFDGLTKLNYLNLSHNVIADLKPGILKFPYLLELDLTGNLLTNIHPGSIKKISMLFLSNNLLRGEELTPSTFDTSYVNFLLLAKNNMADAPKGLLRNMKELNYLNLEDCSMPVIPEFVTTKNMNAMVHLTLKGNKIRKITEPASFNNLDDLRVLNLSRNLIEEIDEDALSPLKKLEKIDLSGNRLKTVTERQFRNTPALTVVDLSGNLITMLPVNAFRGSKLSELNLSFNKITYLQDNFCLELKNSGAVLKAFYFNNNPWQCACLNQLLREVKSMNVVYDAKNYDGGNPVCVTAAQFVCKRQEKDNQLFIDMYSGKTPLEANM